MKKRISILMLIFAMPWILVSSCKEKDSKIQSAVETELKNTNMAGIMASVKDGVVTLTGECNDEASKASLESSVGKIKGVKKVVNNCTVAVFAPSPAPVVISEDEALTKGVTDATKDYPTVKASVQDGVITLTGEIKRASLQKLIMSLNTLKPKKIENKLTIK